MKSVKIVVTDLMQKNYAYYLTEPTGCNFDPIFKPELTPKQMLELGVFGGRYMTDCKKEFPKSWFKNAKLCHEFHNPELNFFKVNASQPLSVWQKKAGYTPMTQEVGFSGIADTLWEEDIQMTKDK